MSEANYKIFKPQDLSESQKNYIKASVPFLEENGVTLTAQFYEYMLNTHKDVRPLFNETNQKLLTQPKILAFSLLNYAKNIDDITPLVGFVRQIQEKHVALQVEPYMYTIVGGCLLETMQKMLGIDASDPLIEAWSVAYGNLAQILIDAEHELYLKNAWQGFRDFTVTKTVLEADTVKSVYFRPSDNGKLALPKRGQSVCIRWSLPNEELEKSRQYSLSQYPASNEYRISVRHIEGGLISTYVHKHLKAGDSIRVACPTGQFVYDDSHESDDVVLFAGGIGITPLIPIIDLALKRKRKVSLIYSNKTVNSRPFGDWFRDLKKIYGDKFQLKEFLLRPQDNSTLIDEAFNRRLEEKDFDFISKNIDVYMLGPVPYMKFVKENLVKRGLEDSNIKSEFFGPYEV